MHIKQKNESPTDQEKNLHLSKKNEQCTDIIIMMIIKGCDERIRHFSATA